MSNTGTNRLETNIRLAIEVVIQFQGNYCMRKNILDGFDILREEVIQLKLLIYYDYSYSRFMTAIHDFGGGSYRDNALLLVESYSIT